MASNLFDWLWPVGSWQWDACSKIAESEATLLISPVTQPRHTKQLPRQPPWDPREEGWHAPSDEDEPWNAALPLTHSIRARCEKGNVQILPRSIGLAPRRARTHMLRPHEETDSDPGEGTVNSPTRCGICFDDLPSKDMITFLCGAHPFCQPCTAQHFKSCLAAEKLPTCPAEGCSQAASIYLTQQILRGQQVAFEKFLMIHLRHSPSLRDCPNCHTEVFLMDGDVGGLPAASSRCPECKHRFCVHCGLPWHGTRVTCKEARQQSGRRARIPTATALALGLKQCPDCHTPVEKVDGCNHVKCANPKCKHEFCWLCLADRCVIFAHGNHFHAPSCPDYAPYDAEPEFIPENCPKCRSTGRPCIPPGTVIL